MSDLVYVVERFPERSQTFVQNELRALHRRAVHPRVFALYSHSDLDTTAGDLAFTRLPSAARRPWRLLWALAVVARRHPGGLLRMLALAAARPSALQLHALAKALHLVAALDVPPRRIHAHFARASASTAMLAAAATGARFSFTAHALDVFVRPFDVDRKLRRADVTVTVCQYNREWMARRWPGLGHVAVVPCGVEPERFRRGTPYRSTPTTVVTVGRLVPKKGFDLLIEACALLRHRGLDLRCRILGDGPERPALEALIARHGLAEHVELAGSVPPDRVRAALEDAALFCLPCRVAADGDRDSQPLVVKEAMAMAIPVVGTTAVGMPEMVDDATGRLVPAEDPGALAAALAELAARGEDELRGLGEAGRRRVEERFSLDGGVASLLAAWEDATGRR